MKHNWRVLALVLAMLCFPAFAQLTPVSVAVVSTGIKATVNEQAQVEILVRNGTNHEVTGYSWVVTGTYPDGSTKSHSGTIDMIGTGSLPAGGTKTIDDTLPLKNGYTPITISASLTMVAFDNNTAVGDKEKVAHFIGIRQDMAQRWAKELAQIDGAMKSASPKDTLKAYLEQRDAVDPDRGAGMARQVLGLLEIDVPRSTLDPIIAKFHAYQNLLEGQSKLEVK
ncbi:MAG: hypothetical protein ABI693_04975 [Bryobacteraceae bacterium]